jgi:hypothetical protein
MLGLNPWLIGGVLLLIAALGVTAYVEHVQLQAADARVDAMRIERDTAKAANVELADTVAELQHTNDELANGRAADQRAAAAAVDALAAKNKTLAAQLAVAKSQREVIYAQDPDAAAWARQPVPGAVADRLRH